MAAEDRTEELSRRVVERANELLGDPPGTMLEEPTPNRPEVRHSGWPEDNPPGDSELPPNQPFADADEVGEEHIRTYDEPLVPPVLVRVGEDAFLYHAGSSSGEFLGSVKATSGGLKARTTESSWTTVTSRLDSLERRRLVSALSVAQGPGIDALTDQIELDQLVESDTGAWTFEGGSTSNEVVRTALAKLQQSEREVLVTRLLLNWSTAETAQLTGQSQGSVRHLLRSAVEKVAESVTERATKADPRADG